MNLRLKRIYLLFNARIIFWDINDFWFLMTFESRYVVVYECLLDERKLEFEAERCLTSFVGFGAASLMRRV